MKIVFFLKKKNWFLGFIQHRFWIRKSGAGFTFVETLVSLTLISVTFIGILSLTNYILANLGYTSQYTVGSYLASEGVELIIKQRDENWLKQKSFSYQLPADKYKADYLGTLSNTEVLQKLKFDETKGYQYEEGAPSAFSRVITISYPNDHTMKVQAEVRWSNRGNPYSVIVEDNLFDWFSVPAE